MSRENRGQPRRVRVALSEWEIDRLLDALTFKPQDRNDKTVMLALWAAKERFKEKPNGNQ